MMDKIFYAFAYDIIFLKSGFTEEKLLQLINDEHRVQLSDAENIFTSFNVCDICRIGFSDLREDIRFLMKKAGVKCWVYLVFENSDSFKMMKKNYEVKLCSAVRAFFSEVLEINDRVINNACSDIMQYVVECSVNKELIIKQERNIYEDKELDLHLLMPVEITDKMNPFAKCPECYVSAHYENVIPRMFVPYDELENIRNKADTEAHERIARAYSIAKKGVLMDRSVYSAVNFNDDAFGSETTLFINNFFKDSHALYEVFFSAVIYKCFSENILYKNFKQSINEFLHAITKNTGNKNLLDKEFLIKLDAMECQIKDDLPFTVCASFSYGKLNASEKTIDIRLIIIADSIDDEAPSGILFNLLNYAPSAYSVMLQKSIIKCIEDHIKLPVNYVAKTIDNRCMYDMRYRKNYPGKMQKEYLSRNFGPRLSYNNFLKLFDE